MHIHDTYDISLSHIPFGRTLSAVRFEKHRYICPGCHSTSMQGVPFQAGGHRITVPLHSFAMLETTDFNQKMTTDFNQYKYHRI